jgi:hypothetical protein
MILHNLENLALDWMINPAARFTAVEKRKSADTIHIVFIRAGALSYSDDWTGCLLATTRTKRTKSGIAERFKNGYIIAAV